MMINRAAAAAAAAALLAGCGSGTRSAAPAAPTATTVPAQAAATPTTVDYAAKFLAIIGPVNKADATFVAQVKDLGNDPASAQVETAAVPFIAALKKMEAELLAVRWPATAEPDVRSMVSDTGTVIGDLYGLGAANVLSASQIETQLVRDEAQLSTASHLVRSDLGLPPS
jgi:hypothetical protein